MNDLDEDSFVRLEHVKESVRAFDDNVRRGPAQWNDDQLRRIMHARAWRSDRLRTCKPKPLLGHGPLIAIKLRIITRKSLGGIQTDLSSRVLTHSGDPAAVREDAGSTLQLDGVAELGLFGVGPVAGVRWKALSCRGAY